MYQERKWRRLQLYKGGEGVKTNTVYCILDVSTIIIFVALLVVAIFELLNDKSTTLIFAVILTVLLCCVGSGVILYLVHDALKYLQQFCITKDGILLKSAFTEYMLENDDSLRFEITLIVLNRNSGVYNRILRCYKSNVGKISFYEKLHYFYKNGNIALHFSYSDKLVRELIEYGYEVTDKTFLVKNSPWQKEDNIIYERFKTTAGDNKNDE